MKFLLDAIWKFYDFITPTIYPKRLSKSERQKLRNLHSRQVLDLLKKNGSLKLDKGGSFKNG